MDDIKQVKHLFARAAFGMRFEDLKHYKGMQLKKAVKSLFHDSETTDPITAVTDNTGFEMLIKGDTAATRPGERPKPGLDKQNGHNQCHPARKNDPVLE